VSVYPQPLTLAVGAGEAGTAEAAPVLRLCDASVRYGRAEKAALVGVSLTLQPGERVALLGPSGGGKTTLLRALEGSLPLNEGTLERGGVASLIYQDLRLVGEATVLANVCNGALGRMPGRQGLFGFPREVVARAKSLLAELGLSEFIDRKASSLSGGQRQRVAIARALCGQPDAILADEPMASLDPANSGRLLEVLAVLQRRHRFALVLSMHDAGPDPDFFDRYIVVRDGKLALSTASAAEAWGTMHAVPAHHPQDSEFVPTPRQDAATEAGAPLWRRVAPAVAVAMMGAAVWWSASALGLVRAASSMEASGVSAFLRRLLPSSWAEVAALPWATLFASLVETIQMALVGTLAGVALSLPMAVMASRATSPRLLRVPARFLLNVVRTVPSIVWALFFVAFVGLGPASGVMALAAYSMGYLTKLFYEGLEDADNRPALALKALGASRLQIFRRAILPTARPALVGACLFVFEYNIRSASILGVVGAGGIGQDLMYYIEWRQFPAAIAGLLMILAIVVGLDAISERWRRSLTKQRGV